MQIRHHSEIVQPEGKLNVAAFGPNPIEALRQTIEASTLLLAPPRGSFVWLGEIGGESTPFSSPAYW